MGGRLTCLLPVQGNLTCGAAMTMAVRCRLTCRVLMAMPGMLTFRVAMTLAVRGRLTCRVLMAMPDLLTFWVAMTVAVRGRLICWAGSSSVTCSSRNNGPKKLRVVKVMGSRAMGVGGRLTFRVLLPVCVVGQHDTMELTWKHLALSYSSRYFCHRL